MSYLYFVSYVAERNKTPGNSIYHGTIASATKLSIKDIEHFKKGFMNEGKYTDLAFTAISLINNEYELDLEDET